MQRSAATKHLRPERAYYVYILSNATRRLYVGVTNDLMRRMYEHKNKLVLGFTQKYNIDWLMYFEETDDISAAIAREKELKGWGVSRRWHWWRQ